MSPREQRIMLVHAGCLILFWLVLVSQVCVASSNRCLKKMSSRNLGVGETIRETRVTLNCDRGDIKWLSARRSHLLTFTKANKDLVVCLSVKRAGARVYRTNGAQRQLIAGVNDTGFLNCFKSECKHVSFLFEVDENYSGPKNLVYSYSGYIDIRCPGCSETCQTDCICTSDFAFHGKLIRSEFRVNTYLHYFQVAEFTKYNGQYQHPLLSHAASRCPAEDISLNSSAIVVRNQSQNALLQERIAAEIPTSGTVRVIAKCPLRTNKTYFVSAFLHITRNGRPRLLMCCQHSDEHFALAHLNQLVHRQVCCRHL